MLLVSNFGMAHQEKLFIWLVAICNRHFIDAGFIIHNLMLNFQYARP